MRPSPTLRHVQGSSLLPAGLELKSEATISSQTAAHHQRWWRTAKEVLEMRGGCEYETETVRVNFRIQSSGAWVRIEPFGRRIEARWVIALLLQPVAGLEDPPHRGEADGQEQQGHAQADADRDVGGLEEAPAEAADQIDDRIEQRERLPDRRQDLDRVEGAAEKRQRR